MLVLLQGNGVLNIFFKSAVPFVSCRQGAQNGVSNGVTVRLGFRQSKSFPTEGSSHAGKQISSTNVFLHACCVPHNRCSENLDRRSWVVLMVESRGGELSCRRTHDIFMRGKSR
jgi:hypothetical protein